MGTWDVGPFENDTAADFAYDLDEAVQSEREALVCAALVRATQARGCLESTEGVEAIAAALVAAQRPGGDPIVSSYGPDEVLPAFASALASIAVEALDRVVSTDSELAELWDETPHGPAWRQSVDRMRASLIGHSSATDRRG